MPNIAQAADIVFWRAKTIGKTSICRIALQAETIIAKDRPGGHVVLFCAGMEEPSELDFTQAAMIAAWYSDAKETKNIPVDYTKVRYLKKPAGAKPGMVIYHTYWSAYVTPEEEKVAALRKK